MLSEALGAMADEIDRKAAAAGSLHWMDCRDLSARLRAAAREAEGLERPDLDVVHLLERPETEFVPEPTEPDAADARDREGA